jgi:hypothetical protein
MGLYFAALPFVCLWKADILIIGANVRFEG